MVATKQTLFPMHQSKLLILPCFLKSLYNVSVHSSTLVHLINENHDNSQVPWPFRISFMYYSLLGTVIVYVVGIPVSYMTSKEEDLCHLDERLITPMLRKGLRSKKAQFAEKKVLDMELTRLCREQTME